MRLLLLVVREGIQRTSERQYDTAEEGEPEGSKIGRPARKWAVLIISQLLHVPP